MNTTYDVCFVGLKCADLLLHREVPRYAGGIERVLVALARGFASLDYKVAFIVYAEDGLPAASPEGIDLVAAFDRDHGVRFVRSVHPRSTGLFRAIRNTRAKYYLQMGAGLETLQTFIAVSLFYARSRFVFCSGSDSDCRVELPLISSSPEKRMYRWAITRLKKVVVQTQAQLQLMKQSFGVDSVAIPMPYDRPGSTLVERSFDHVPRVLWVGRVVEVKRLELLVAVARVQPELQFDIVGAANADSDYARAVVDEAKALPNVIVHGRISDSALEALYASAAVLCCSSILEGFPTTFLEAWSFGKPVVTTFDPDNVVATHQLGVVCDAEALAATLQTFLDDLELYKASAQRARTFYEDHYTSEKIVPRYVALMDNLLPLHKGAAT